MTIKVPLFALTAAIAGLVWQRYKLPLVIRVSLLLYNLYPTRELILAHVWTPVEIHLNLIYRRCGYKYHKSNASQGLSTSISVDIQWNFMNSINLPFFLHFLLKRLSSCSLNLSSPNECGTHFDNRKRRYAHRNRC